MLRACAEDKIHVIYVLYTLHLLEKKKSCLVIFCPMYQGKKKATKNGTVVGCLAIVWVHPPLRSLYKWWNPYGLHHSNQPNEDVLSTTKQAQLQGCTGNFVLKGMAGYPSICSFLASLFWLNFNLYFVFKTSLKLITSTVLFWLNCGEHCIHRKSS